MMIKEKNKIIYISVVVMVLFAVFLGGYFYYKLNKVEKGGEVLVQKELDELLNKVSLIYLFPENENPTIATVSDPELLKGQSFFEMAQTGDKVLIFAKSGKAVLYRPSLNKIIEITNVLNDSNKKLNNEISQDAN